MKLNKLLITAIVVVVGVLLYYSRWIVDYRYEPEYYENLFYQSQWNVPNSTRGISDGELYKFVGYRLVLGENPFNINFEVPPLGKYLYGLSEYALGNPYWMSLLMYFMALMVMWKWSEDLWGERQLTWITVLLLVTTPFVATQLAETMLDLPLMLILMIHGWLFSRYVKDKKWFTLMLAGGFLGLATGVKAPVYTPLLGLVGIVMIVWVNRSWWQVLTYPGAVVTGYVTAWFCYFMRHPNPIPWMRLHEKPLKFYLEPDNKVEYLNQWKGIFANTYQGWWSPGRSTSLGDWSFILPLGVISLLIILVWGVKRKEKSWVYIALMSGVILSMNTVVPFFPRYLMPTIPLFILMLVQVFKRWRLVLVVLAIANLPFFYSSIVVDDLPGHTQAVARFIQTRAYRELYRSMPTEQRKQIGEDEYIKTVEGFLDTIKTRDVSVEMGPIDRDGDKASALYTIVYNTRYGRLVHQPTIKFVKEKEQWRMVWDYEYIWKGINQGDVFETKEENIVLTALLDKNGRIMAKRGRGNEVWIIPRLMYDWNNSINHLAKLTGLDSMEVDRRTKRVVPGDFPRFVGMLRLDYTGDLKSDLTPGERLKEVPYIEALDKSEANYLQTQIKDLLVTQADIFQPGVKVMKNGEVVIEKAAGEGRKEMTVKL